MDCGTTAYASEVLERYGYYRLSGYWHLYRAQPVPPTPRVDSDGREIRLDTFVPDTTLERVVALYEFDHELRTRLGDALSTIETTFRFYIGHRLGRMHRFVHRDPLVLGAAHQASTDAPPEPTTAYSDWIAEYDVHEKRARGDFVMHFRQKYGPHLPIWVATEVMSFGLLGSLYGLMPQGDQEILAARFQVSTAGGRGDRGAMSNWLNNLRNVRNICAHYGRLWNRTFDVVIDAPGLARSNPSDRLAPLVDAGVKNKLYGVLLIVRHLLLSITPERQDLVDLVEFIATRSREIGVSTAQLGFPQNWRENPIWGREFTLDASPMMAASLLDKAHFLTAVETRAALTGAKVTKSVEPRTSEQSTRALKAAQRSLLRTYLKHDVVIEVELGETRYYPAFQFRDGKIIDALAEINKAFQTASGYERSSLVAAQLLDWWQTPQASLPKSETGVDQSPLDLLETMTESTFEETIGRERPDQTFGVPDLQ